MDERDEPYRSLFERNLDGVFMVDQEGRFLAANASAEKMSGYTVQELQQITFEAICAPDQLDKTVQAFRRALNGEGQDLETTMVCKDGRRMDILLTGGPIVIGDSVGGLFVIVKDITPRKRTEEELVRERDELECRICERTTELQRAVDMLRHEAENRKIAEQNLRESSHQLRLLASQLSVAEQREREKLAQILHDDLQQILASAKFRLAEQTEDLRTRDAKVASLLDSAISITRSLASELSPPVLKKRDLVKTMQWLAEWMRETHGLDVELDAPESLGPPSYELVLLLFQSVRELLFNVVKHARVKSARIEIARQRNRIRVIVRDEGAGFDPEQLRAERAASTGFGLLNIRERIRLLGGRLFIQSAPGQGSRFVLMVPVPHSGVNCISAEK